MERRKTIIDRHAIEAVERLVKRQENVRNHSLAKKAKNEYSANLNNNINKIDKWFDLYSIHHVDFSNNEDLFININSEEDLNKYKNRIESILSNNG